MAYTRIDVARARELIDQHNAAVVDVRDPASYEAGHILGAEAIDQANVQAFVEAADRARPLIVCCYHGNMSQGAADYFNQHGFTDTYSLDGGFEAWQTASAGAQLSKD
jgi:thiosulfate sulfurtransferase